MSQANFVQVRLAAAAGAADTSLTVESAGAAYNLPPADGGVLTLTDSIGAPAAYEVVRYAGRSGTGPTYTLTGVSRGLEGTAARSWSTGHYALMGLTAGELRGLLDTKVDKTTAVSSVAGRTGAVTLAKADVGLDNVDNTSDVNKPVSTAQQTALNLKANIDSPTLTGDPKAPTPAATDNDTSIATTAHVKAAMGLFGLGAQAPVVTDLNTVSDTRLFSYSGNTVNAPTSAYGGGIQVLQDAPNKYQVVWTDSRAYTRTCRGGTWSAWQELWHTGNLIKQSSPTDTTAGSLVTTEGLTARAGTAGALGFRNKIINGKMEIAQRGTSFAPPTGYTLDRWTTVNTTGLSTTIAAQADAPNTEFSTSLRVTVNATKALAAGDTYAVAQLIEGYNVKDLISKPVTLSFWVRSSKTGVHCISLINTTDRSYVSEYVVNAANTWEKKTITIADGLITSGAWNWTNGIGLGVRFALSNGSQRQTTAGAWQTGDLYSTANQVNCLDAVGNIFAITGVQLEAGEVATPFEHRPYGLELSLCQRYFIRSTRAACTVKAGGTWRGTSTVFPVRMRAAPTLAFHTLNIQGDWGNLNTTATQDGFTPFGTNGNPASYEFEGYDVNAEL